MPISPYRPVYCTSKIKLYMPKLYIFFYLYMPIIVTKMNRSKRHAIAFLQQSKRRHHKSPAVDVFQDKLTAKQTDSTKRGVALRFTSLLQLVFVHKKTITSHEFAPLK